MQKSLPLQSHVKATELFCRFHTKKIGGGFHTGCEIRGVIGRVVACHYGGLSYDVDFAGIPRKLSSGATERFWRMRADELELISLVC